MTHRPDQPHLRLIGRSTVWEPPVVESLPAEFVPELRELESEDDYHDTQEFLSTVELLARERRLSRYVFVAARPDG